jgi:hypothetical protein
MLQANLHDLENPRKLKETGQKRKTFLGVGGRRSASAVRRRLIDFIVMGVRVHSAKAPHRDPYWGSPRPRNGGASSCAEGGGEGGVLQKKAPRFLIKSLN